MRTEVLDILHSPFMLLTNALRDKQVNDHARFYLHGLCRTVRHGKGTKIQNENMSPEGFETTPGVVA